MTRTIRLALSSLALSLAVALPAAAQDMTPEQQAAMAAYQAAATPGPAHAKLAASVGTWDMAITSWDAPGAPPTTSTGTATRRMILGGRVMVEEAESTMMGQPFSGMGLHGYDNVSGRHWATWSDTMGTGLMLSDGACDEAGACTFHGSWNDPVTKDKIHAHMTSRWSAPDTEVFEMYAVDAEGAEAKMMEIVYTKRK